MSWILSALLLLLPLQAVTTHAAPSRADCVIARVQQGLRELEPRVQGTHLESKTARIQRRLLHAILAPETRYIQSILQTPPLRTPAGDLTYLESIRPVLESSPERTHLDLARRAIQHLQTAESARSSLITTHRYQKDFKGLPRTIQTKIEDQHLPAILENPLIGRVKETLPNEIHVLSFTGPGVHYRLAYRKRTDGKIELLMVGPHEGFYERLHRHVGR